MIPPKNDLQETLFSMRDEKYADFHSRLMPNIDKERIIGIRTPILRKFAAEFEKSGKAEAFLKELPHTYYEENNLHAFLIERTKDYDKAISLLEEFLPYVDNWATCDSMSPKVLGKHKTELLQNIKAWVCSEHTYTARFGLEMIMSYYLEEPNVKEYLSLAFNVKNDDYYVKMMIAWLFATALAKNYDEALTFFTTPCLDPWTHNKALQKARESYRITAEQKEYLKSLKI